MKKLLIIEDDPFVQRMYKRMFSLNNVAIDMAGTGAEGLKLAASAKADLILLDIMLPDMTGIEVLKKLKENTQTKHIKVIVLSNSGDELIQDQAKTLGAIGYMTKADVSPDQVIESVEKAMGN